MLLGSRQAARRFTCEEPYAMISIVDTEPGLLPSPPRILRPSSFCGRIVIRCDDVLDEPASTYGHSMTVAQAQRIARFVIPLAPRIEALFVHCRQGVSRSAGAGLAIAQVYHIGIQNIEGELLFPNPHIRKLESDAVRALMV